MQLDELIEEYTIESIAKKTNVAEGVITKLLNQEFETMKLPQTLGALSIIEREYGVELDTLRQECKAYFAGQKTSESALSGLAPVKNKRRIVPRLLVFVLLALLAYGAWYFFPEYYKQKILPMDQKSEKSLNDTTLSSSDTASKDVKSNITTESSPQGDVSKDITGDSVAVSNTNSPIVKQGSKSNKGSPVIASETVIEEDAESNQGTLSAVLETIANEKNNTATVAETNVTAEAADTAGKPPVVLARETMMLIPKGVMWFRLIDLDTKERRSFKRIDRYEIDLKKNDWLFATEDARFVIIDDDRFEEFSGEGKLFFQLDQEGIHQLSEEEFRAAEK